MSRAPSVLSAALVTAAASLVFGVGAAGAGSNQPGGCPAFGQFMGTAASSSAQSQHPLGQAVRQLTPFNEALAVFKTNFCGG
jgi:hypothetical protein